MCLAAADDVTRQRCVRIIKAASAGGASSSLSDIASSAAVTPGLFMMRSVLAVNAVLAALGRTAARGLDLPSLKAAGFTAAEAKAAGFTAADVKAEGYDFASAQSAGYHLLPLIAAFGYETVAASGCDMSCILVSRASAPAACMHPPRAPAPTHPPSCFPPHSATAPTCTRRCIFTKSTTTNCLTKANSPI